MGLCCFYYKPVILQSVYSLFALQFALLMKNLLHIFILFILFFVTTCLFAQPHANKDRVIIGRCELNDGSTIVVGDERLPKHNIARAFIARISKDSVELWAKSAFTPSYGQRDDLSLVTFSADGNIYAAGTIVYQSQHRLGAAVYKFTLDGTLVWVKEVGSGVGDPLYIKAHPDNSVEVGFETKLANGSQYVVHYEPSGKERSRWVVDNSR